MHSVPHRMNTAKQSPAKFVPTNLSASGLACWWSITRLIESAPDDCWFWTLTIVEQVSDNVASNMHRELTRQLAQRVREGLWPRGWGGVKVVEIHPGGHGLHFHWVIKGRVPIRVLLDTARPLGFGRITVDEKPAGLATAGYLAKYLTKQKHQKLDGLRRWGCLGSYQGVRSRDIEFLSPSVAVFRQAYREAIAAGKPSPAAWNHAKVIQRAYDHNHQTHDEHGEI